MQFSNYDLYTIISIQNTVLTALLQRPNHTPCRICNKENGHRPECDHIRAIALGSQIKQAHATASR